MLFTPHLLSTEDGQRKRSEENKAGTQGFETRLPYCHSKQLILRLEL